MMDDDDLGLDPEFATRFGVGGRAPCQLYLISPPVISDDFAGTLAAALKGGPVAAFQLRLKDASDEEVLRAAERLMPVCAAHEVAFILNDRMDLAKALASRSPPPKPTSSTRSRGWTSSCSSVSRFMLRPMRFSHGPNSHRPAQPPGHANCRAR